MGQQMNALEIIQSNLIMSVRGPVGNGTGRLLRAIRRRGLGVRVARRLCRIRLRLVTALGRDLDGAGDCGVAWGAWWMYVQPQFLACETRVLTCDAGSLKLPSSEREIGLYSTLFTNTHSDKGQGRAQQGHRRFSNVSFLPFRRFLLQ